MGHLFSDFWTTFESNGQASLYAAGIVTILEFALARKVGFDLRPRLSGAVTWLILLVLTVAISTAMGAAMGNYRMAPAVTLHIASWTHADNSAVRIASWAVALLATLFISEFWSYWFHRLQHTNRFLWRFHRIHHSIRDLNALSGADHLTNPVFIVPFLIPIMLLFVVDAGAWPAIVTSIGWLHGFYVHSTVPIGFGPLRYIIGDNRYHRVHHSLDPAHFDKNFASWFPLWDIVFGTAYFPKRDEVIEPGIAGTPGPTAWTFAAIPASQPELQTGARALAS